MSSVMFGADGQPILTFHQQPTWYNLLYSSRSMETTLRFYVGLTRLSVVDPLMSL